MIVNTNKIIFCPFCFFFYFSATQTTPSGFGGCPPSPSGGSVFRDASKLSAVRHRAPPVFVPLSLGVCLSVGVPPLSEGRPKRQQDGRSRHHTSRATESRTEGRTPPPIQEHHQHKEKPRNASGAVCVGFISTVSRFRQVARRETESSKRERTFFTPPHAKVKRFVSVVLVYCVAMSGCPFFNAAVSIRELVTVL